MSDFCEMYEEFTKNMIKIFDDDLGRWVPLSEFKKNAVLNLKPYKEEISVWVIN